MKLDVFLPSEQTKSKYTLQEAGMKRKNERIITDQKIEEYGQWLERCEKSGETIKKYRQYLKQFKEYTGDEPVTKEMVLLWKADLRRRITPVTINCVIAALNGFFKYYRWDGCESKFLKISKSSFYPERKELSKNEYKRLVKTAIANGNGAGDYLRKRDPRIGAVVYHRGGYP